MQVLSLARQHGKTTRLLYWLEEKADRVLITFSGYEAQRLKELKPTLANRIYSFHAWKRQVFSRHEYEIAVDNIDIILYELLGNVTIISLTGEN